MKWKFWKKEEVKQEEVKEAIVLRNPKVFRIYDSEKVQCLYELIGDTYKTREMGKYVVWNEVRKWIPCVDEGKWEYKYPGNLLQGFYIVEYGEGIKYNLSEDELEELVEEVI